MPDALEAPWPVLSLPDALSERVVFKELADLDVIEAYYRMEGQTIAPSYPPAKASH